MQFKNILVVCIGNICRSPMAEYILKQKYPDLHIESAGISAMSGHAADDKAYFTMLKYGIDLKPHIARQLDTNMVRHADLILVMSQNQQKHIEQKWPFATGKTYRIGHWQRRNVPDPYQQDQFIFDETSALIQSCIDDWKQHI